jgi:AraC family transcriptional regulator
MADSLQFASFASVDLLHLIPTEPLLPTTKHKLSGGIMASAGCSWTTGATFDIASIDEHLLFVHLNHKMHLDVRVAGTVKTAVSTRGDIVLIPRGHDTHWKTSGMAACLILAIPNALITSTALQAADADGSRCELLTRVGYADPLLLALGDAVFEHLHNGGLQGDLYLDTLLAALTMHILRRHTEIPVQVSHRDGCLATPILRHVIDYIDSHLDQTLSLAEIAALAQYSPYHFARCFCNSTGQTLHQYILARRLERAKYVLEHTDTGIAEIAQSTGFTDHSHLTSLFRRAYHVTPSQYRTQVRSRSLH